jgi:hypothetical protein
MFGNLVKRLNGCPFPVPFVENRFWPLGKTQADPKFIAYRQNRL